MMDVALGDDESWWCLCAGAAIEHDAASIRVSARLEVVLSTTYGSSHRRRPSAECGFDRSKRWCADLKDGVHIYPWLEVFEQIFGRHRLVYVLMASAAVSDPDPGGKRERKGLDGWCASLSGCAYAFLMATGRRPRYLNDLASWDNALKYPPPSDGSKEEEEEGV
ncbi:hypothetical protein Tsubulata_029617 [Turnera subulata]|uniref:Uncharacterized protein n=1 Tax=Turnera subulata TaxID=218843 RepID=A0A9Q0FQ21_9ROSI|nr:hypothetical protein Tsubulata_029617 [Turnera subulata]